MADDDMIEDELPPHQFEDGNDDDMQEDDPREMLRKAGFKLYARESFEAVAPPRIVALIVDADSQFVIWDGESTPLTGDDEDALIAEALAK